MAKEISELTGKTTPIGTDEIEIQETGGGTSKKATLTNVWANQASPTATSGDSTISNGNLVIGTSGKGIDFSANTDDSGGSITNETLDDFEEGTYTCTIVGSTSGNLGMSSATLAYQKTANLCHLQGQLAINADNSLSGTARFLLPFTSANLVGVAGRSSGDVALHLNGSAFESPHVSINEGNAYFEVSSYPTAGNVSPISFDESNSDASFVIAFNFSYFTA